MANGMTVELVLFRLKDGVDTQAFLAAADAIMPDLRAMQGFVRRELLHDANGQWADVVYWASHDDALAAAEAVQHLASMQPFGSRIDEATVTMLHLAQGRVYNEQ
jgi:heme-degrading monooxygenase HmoA